MKKRLHLKGMLILAVMLLTGANVWGAGYVRTLNEELSVPGYKAKAFYDFQINSPEVLPVSGDLRYRDGEIWGLHNFGSGAREAVVSIPVAEGEILVIQEYSADYPTTINRGAENANLTATTGYRVFDITETGSDVAFKTPRYGGIVAALVMEVDASVATAEYTINYKYNGTIVKTVSGTGAVGSSVAIDASFFEGDVKYFLADNEPSSVTIEAEGNEYSVNVRLAATYNYSLVSSLGGTIATGSGLEGENVTVPYSCYILEGNSFYESAVTNNEYRKTFALSANNISIIVDYTKKEGVDVVFFEEAENIDGMTESTTGNIPVRASNAKAGVSAEDVLITTLPAGKYILHAGVFTSKSDFTSNDYYIYFGVGSDIFEHKFTQVNRHEPKSVEYVLTENTEIKYLGTATSEGVQFDYIWIEKTGSVETTGINTVNAQTENGVIYNLQGQQVQKTQKGLYIVDGKKVIVK